MKKELLFKLSNYSIFSTAFILVSENADAQLIYTDVDPDAIAFADEVQLDMDQDGDVDFKVVFNVETAPSFTAPDIKLRLNPLGENKVAFSTEIVPVTYSGLPWATYTGGATQILFTVAPVFNSGEVIDDAFNFHTEIVNLYELLNFNIYSSYDHQALAGGDWNLLTDKFAGFQIYLDGQYHYGWMRLSVSSETGIVVHDYAYEANPDTPVTTAIVNYSTQWNFAQDLGTTGTGEDLQVSFIAPADEEDIDAYRIVCVKSAIADDFNYEIANSLNSDQYIEIIPDGSPEYLTSFNALSQDSDGEVITTGQPYKIFIFQMMNAATGFENIVSKPSEQVELVDIVAAAVDLDVLDLYNLGNGSDITVSFSEPENNQGISEYRILIVQKDAADLFNLEEALLIEPENYTSIAPGLEDYILQLEAFTNDVNGIPIQPEKYKCFILSIADGSSANTSALTEPSPVFTLETQTSVISSILLEDIAETGNGSDIKISFNKPVYEQTIDEYRIFLVDFTTAFDFDINAAQTIELPNYISIEPTGNDIVFSGDATLRDSQGNLIIWGVPYYVYILSKATVYGIDDTLSPPSNQLVLNFPVLIHNENSLNSISLFVENKFVHLNLNSALLGRTTFTISNMLGNILFEAEIQSQENVFELNIPSGVYIGSVWNGNDRFSQTLFIKH